MHMDFLLKFLRLSIHNGIILVELAAILSMFKEYSLTTTLPPRQSQLVNYWHINAYGLSIEVSKS